MLRDRFGARRLACWHLANNKQQNRLKSSQHTCNLFWRMIYLRTVFFFEKNPVHTCVFSNTTIPIWDKTRRWNPGGWYFQHDVCKSFEEWKSRKENKQVLKLGRGAKVWTLTGRDMRVRGWKIRKQSACQNRLTVLVRPCQTPLTLLVGPRQNPLIVQGVQKTYLSEINTNPIWDDNR